MKPLWWVLVLALVSASCGGATAGRGADFTRLCMVMNENNFGGKLVVRTCAGDTDVYVFERTLEYKLSPDAQRVAVTDTAGVAYFVTYVIDRQLRRINLTEELLRIRPQWSEYGGMYATVKRWKTNDSVVFAVYGYGPMRPGLPSEVQEEIVVKIPPIGTK